MGRSLGIRSEAAEVRGETLLCTLPFGLAMLQHAPHVGAPSLQLRRIFALLLSMTRTTSTKAYSPLRGSTFGKGPLSSPLFLVLVMCAQNFTKFSCSVSLFGFCPISADLPNSASESTLHTAKPTCFSRWFPHACTTRLAKPWQCRFIETNQYSMLVRIRSSRSFSLHI